MKDRETIEAYQQDFRPVTKMIKTLSRVLPRARGIRKDLKNRSGLYLSDWTDAWNYRVVPSTIYIFFANILPAIAFAQDMFDRTKGAYGVNEVLMGSAMGGIVFGLLGGQPLCIVGVTGPITIFNYTVFQIFEPRGVNYFALMTWICLWSFIMHSIIAIYDGVKYMKYVTKFSCDIFGLFINIIYIEKGVQILTRQFNINDDVAACYFGVVQALCILIFGVLFIFVGEQCPLGTPQIRKFILDYSLPLIVVFFTGFTYFPGRISKLHVDRLPIKEAFLPSTEEYGRNHGWFIHFWDLGAGYMFLAIPFALLLTALFYFDHNISSIMCQTADYNLRKPPSFHWDFFLLGCTTLVAGFLGIPPPNGLIPQAPLHTASLATTETNKYGSRLVVEQRFSNTVQGLMTVGFMTGPFLRILHLVPQGVLAGLFFMMGVPGLLKSEILHRVALILTEPERREKDEPIYKIRQLSLFAFLFIEALGVAGEVAITQTIAAVGFPGVLCVLMVIGVFLKYLIPADDLEVLDGPAAGEFIMNTLDPKHKKLA